jgi:hypothetical protein
VRGVKARRGRRGKKQAWRIEMEMWRENGSGK